MKGFFGSLSFRLFISLVGIIAAVLVIYSALNIHTISNFWIVATREHAVQTSELIKRATHYGMLLNRKEDVHQTIRQIAQEPGIAGIRIYDKQGTIIFSADEKEIGRSVDMEADACVTCHSSAQPIKSVPVPDRIRMYTGPHSQNILGMITPIENQKACARSGCHVSPQEKSILGVLDVQMSMNRLDETLLETKTNIFYLSIGVVILIGLFSGIFIFRLVRVPILSLMKGTQDVAEGQLDIRISEKGPKEFRRLARSFNQMTEALYSARTQLKEWSSGLEKKVVEKTEELGRSHRQIVQMEKMASLGKLSASVAHELNNPLAGVLTYAKLVSRNLKDSKFQGPEIEDIRRSIEHIQRETARCGDIVKNLLVFARDSKMKVSESSINEIIERSTMVVRHHLEMAGIQLNIVSASPDVRICCDANQIQQALVALFVNAVEAMPDGGALTVSAQKTENGATVEVRDTGVGIAAEHLPRIFEPFYSTKESTNSVGLGLSVVYGIVTRHGGNIDVSSALGEGTTFLIELPYKAPENIERRRETK